MTIKFYKKEDCWYFQYKTVEYRILCDIILTELSRLLDKDDVIYLKVKFSELPRGLSLTRIGSSSFWPTGMLIRLLRLAKAHVLGIEIGEENQELPLSEEYMYVNILDIF